MANLTTKSEGLERAAHIYRQLRRTRPATRADLKNYVKVFLGLDIPDKKNLPRAQQPDGLSLAGEGQNHYADLFGLMD